MRVTQASEQTQFLATIDTLESNISTSENQLSSGLSFTSPADNPAAAGEVANYDQTLAQSQQYSTNGTSAQTGLTTEDTALTQVQTQLQSLRDLALEANSGTQSPEGMSAIATQAQQIQNSLLGLGNTQDGNGNYIFAGFDAQTQPFAATAAGASYAGDQGQLQVQIAAGQTIAAGDSGAAVFNNIKTGNGTFAVAAGAANTGSGLLGAATLSVPTTYAGGAYTITFTAPTATTPTNATAYSITDTTTGAALTTGTYTPGQTISYGGVQVALTGQPSIPTAGPPPTAGDTFTVAPSTNQSVFTTVQNLITAIQTAGTSSAAKTQLSNTIAGSLSNIDQALNNASTVQSSVGGRLNAITTQQSVQTSQQTQLQTTIASLQGVNYASAYTTLEAQNTTLSAAFQAFALTQGLTLFKYIS